MKKKNPSIPTIQTLKRQALICLNIDGSDPDSEEVRVELKRALEAVDESAKKLRKEHGIRVPNLKLNWDPIHTENPSPASTIAAYPGDQSTVRLTVSCESVDDDTVEEDLLELGITHLIGLELQNELESPEWVTDSDGAMIAKVRVRLCDVSWVIHDIFLDMALVYSKGQNWFGVKQIYNAARLAAGKAEFARRYLSNRPNSNFKISDTALHFPLVSLLRNGRRTHDIALENCQEIWSRFWDDLNSGSSTARDNSREKIVSGILENHRFGGQISPAKLRARIGRLSPGHHRIYFLVRKPKSTRLRVKIANFLEINPKYFRGQRWVIKKTDAVSTHDHQSTIHSHERIAKMLFVDRYMVRYDFFRRWAMKNKETYYVGYFDMLGVGEASEVESDDYQNQLIKFRQAICDAVDQEMIDGDKVFAFSDCAFLRSASLDRLVEAIRLVRHRLWQQNLFLRGQFPNPRRHITTLPS
ncbi:MAG: hypothetical protein IPJ30_12580 [Acidobacteria bacterium]|nr:hypothetical protein [Acidobacteriota bacterium]